jgi:hypothetical protein
MCLSVFTSFCVVFLFFLLLPWHLDLSIFRSACLSFVFLSFVLSSVVRRPTATYLLFYFSPFFSKYLLVTVSLYVCLSISLAETLSLLQSTIFQVCNLISTARFNFLLIKLLVSIYLSIFY